ncbi:ANL_collapsed_G0033930.mRNA.1.CDS.1 [Saccharomyces cerevisiae]|nr:ANL_HP_G0030010.mRNA.1.CDS.1 [Saccharomyces cerevisiae]CAI4976832.1 ANL_HP_G0036140.mRNA.1.CDS.1 [Saccharomyces cerevisiae]CAI5075644.1 AVN_HP_G0088280.mRNA.1.CDS.1 [Saccharomyces cerevisiae]CAI5214920.1 ANL_HP_G0174740.mRNA.1.CDS.1 [Saccharomyces cerevisiae]CAI6716744.1 ANL_HP_G0030010.mRNA.1.CDS.1 [Saccharomyces cerevisiae]
MFLDYSGYEALTEINSSFGKQIMEIGPLVRRSPAVLVVEFDCPVEDCLDELDPLHPLNRAYIFIHKQWTYYHQYYIVEKVKKGDS